jgi:ATP-dependent Lhr-like helicase
MFATLLRDLGSAELIQQEADGLLLLGRVGESIVNHFSFYAAFTTTDEYRLVTGSRTLGTMPLFGPVIPGQLLIFAGRRWQVQSVDDRAKLIELAPASGGRAPLFFGGAAQVGDAIRQRMRQWYESDDVPNYLDATAQRLLDEGRRSYRRLRLNTDIALAWGEDTVVFAWLGDRVLDTLAVWLTAAGFQTGRDGVALTVAQSTPAELGHAVREILNTNIPNGVELAATVPNTTFDKYDTYLGPQLRNLAYAHGQLDIPRATEFLTHLADVLPVADADPIDGRPPAIAAPQADGLDAMPFAVVDLETTGFAARRRDRITEIAIIRLAPDGTTLGEWSSLVNPERGPGATSVHGLTSVELRTAPRFADIAHLVADQLDGAVLVAHNLPFDRAFLEAELARAGKELPIAHGLCTLRLDEIVHGKGRRTLRDCCISAGITDLEPAGREHSALADARSTARLLRYHIRRQDQWLSLLSTHGGLNSRRSSPNG